MNNHCKICDIVGHTAFYCPEKARLTTSQYKKRKVAGKYGYRWSAARKKWKQLNPPNFEGYYECWICHKWVPDKEMEVDHVIPRSRAPELRYEMSNLKPSCHECNFSKGSKVLD